MLSTVWAFSRVRSAPERYTGNCDIVLSPPPYPAIIFPSVHWINLGTSSIDSTKGDVGRLRGSSARSRGRSRWTGADALVPCPRTEGSAGRHQPADRPRPRRPHSPRTGAAWPPRLPTDPVSTGISKPSPSIVDRAAAIYSEKSHSGRALARGRKTAPADPFSPSRSRETVVSTNQKAGLGDRDRASSAVSTRPHAPENDAQSCACNCLRTSIPLIEPLAPAGKKDVSMSTAAPEIGSDELGHLCLREKCPGAEIVERSG